MQTRSIFIIKANSLQFPSGICYNRTRRNKMISKLNLNSCYRLVYTGCFKVCAVYIGFWGYFQRVDRKINANALNKRRKVDTRTMRYESGWLQWSYPLIRSLLRNLGFFPDSKNQIAALIQCEMNCVAALIYIGSSSLLQFFDYKIPTLNKKILI